MGKTGVILYSTPTCPYCKLAKDYLTRKNVSFKEYNVADDQKAASDMIKLSGQIGVPQIVIGNKVIVGYDSDEINQALME